MVSLMRIAGLLAAATVSLVSLSARADTARAWSAARAGLPADAKLVIGLDLAAVQKTQLFTQLWPVLLEKADATKVINEMKAQCKIDPLVVVQSFVLAMTGDQDEGAAYVALSGIDKARLSSCLQREIQAHADKGAKVTIKQDGNVTQVSDGKDSMFLGWVSKDVVVVPLHTQDRATLLKWMSGNGALAKTTVGKTLGKVNTSAAMWGAGEGAREFEPGIVITGGYGAVTFARGNVDANVHAKLENAGQASAMASSAQKQLDELRQTPLLPAAIGGLLKAITLAAASDEVTLKANVIEKDLVAALTMALAMAGQ
jgi:hypothetical protein